MVGFEPTSRRVPVREDGKGNDSFCQESNIIVSLVLGCELYALFNLERYNRYSMSLSYLSLPAYLAAAEAAESSSEIGLAAERSSD
jgi:hypothetical protein